ncbi:MAG: DUF362 domain-containing protein [Candidatus Bathyarchaeia archaeon]
MHKEPKDKSIVAIATGESIDRITEEAVNLIGGLKSIIRPGNKVLIKPNCNGGRDPWKGPTTKPEFIRKLVEMSWEAGAGEVWVGEHAGGSVDTMTAFEKTGVGPAASEAGARLIPFDKSEYVEVNVRDPVRFNKLHVAREVLECDVYIDVPALKTHHAVGISGALKDALGLISNSERTAMHIQGLNEGIVDSRQVRLPDLVVGDAYICVEGLGPFWGPPVRLEACLASRDSLAIDVITAIMMGFHPNEVMCLKMAQEKCLGAFNYDPKLRFSDIEIRGVELEKVMRPFLRPLTHIQQRYKELNGQIEAHTTKACTGCFGSLTTALWGPPGKARKDLAEKTRYRCLKFYAGPIDKPERGPETIVIGDCQSKWREYGLFVPGCPVTPDAIVSRIEQIVGPLKKQKIVTSEGSPEL